MSRVDTDATTFGELLIAMRKKGGIPQHALAEKLGVHRNTISKWERGICLPESKTLVLELAHQLRLEMGDARRLLEASLTSLSPHWHVPYQHNPFFTGREALLHHLHEVLGYKQTAVLSQSYTLSGLGGIGKTQMAVEYAYRYANDYAAILWVGAETRESMLSSFTAIADLLSLTVQKNQDHLIATVKPWLADHREWLVIFDNVEDLGLLEAVLPTARCGAILLTTRRQEVGIIAPVLTLETMTPEEGLQLLLRRANIGDLALSPVEIQAARGIVASMDGLPLALDQAGAYIAAAKCSVSDFLHLSQTSHLRLLAEREAQANHPLSVVRTFTLAFEQLQRSNPAAAELLRVCAFLAPEAIPVAFFIEGATHLSSTLESLASDPFQFNEAVKGCLTYSLLQRDAAARTVTVHRLVQAVLKGSLSEEVQRTWTARVIRAMAQLFPREKTRADYWQACERLLPHALACGTSGDLWDEDIPERIILISNVATYLSNRARFAEAEPLFQRALRAWEQALDPEHPRVANVLHGLATLYRQQGKYEQAEPLLRRAVRAWEQAQGPEHLLVTGPLSNLAELYFEQGKYREAEVFYERALRIREQALGTEHPLVAEPLIGLAALSSAQGQYEQAALLYQRALTLRQRHLGPQHPDIAQCLHHLARLHQVQQQTTEALSLYQQALTLYDRALGPQHPKTRGTRTAYTHLLRDLGRMDEAAALEDQVAEERE